MFEAMMMEDIYVVAIVLGCFSMRALKDIVGLIYSVKKE